MSFKPIRIKQQNPAFDFDAQIKYYTEIHEQLQKMWEKIATNPTPNERVPIFDRDNTIPEIRMNVHFWDAKLKDNLSCMASTLQEHIYFLKCAKVYHAAGGEHG
jgi:hypothetical protein